ncbi:hypothetical protein H70357_19450 [Paenibacillus sp. FSL H7-0357]|nr:hypothetical protein H70357_19450 [Paenibacillus sp. FSL H7-0357]
MKLLFAEKKVLPSVEEGKTFFCVLPFVDNPKKEQCKKIKTAIGLHQELKSRKRFLLKLYNEATS